MNQHDVDSVIEIHIPPRRIWMQQAAGLFGILDLKQLVNIGA